MASKVEAIGELRARLREMLSLMAGGSTFPKLARAQGYVDGYMRALLETRQATEKELLAIVSEVRAEQSGAATTVVDLEASAA
jgi:hypothetical protein